MKEPIRRQLVPTGVTPSSTTSFLLRDSLCSASTRAFLFPRLGLAANNRGTYLDEFRAPDAKHDHWEDNTPRYLGELLNASLRNGMRLWFRDGWSRWSTEIVSIGDLITSIQSVSMLMEVIKAILIGANRKWDGRPWVLNFTLEKKKNYITRNRSY